MASAHAATIREDFASDPFGTGWHIAGDETLFSWNPADQNLRVTWDSNKPNSFFYRPLGTPLSKGDDFSFTFTIAIDEISIGVAPSKPFTFQLAVGLINQNAFSATNLFRGTGADSPNLVEFTYFPDSGFGATVSPIIVSTNNQFIPSFTFPVELVSGEPYEISLSYTATNRTLQTVMRLDGEPVGPVKDVVLPAHFTDFVVDAFSVSSYNHERADGSVIAHGQIDNIVIQTPDPLLVQGRRVNSGWEVGVPSRTGWKYLLEKSTDLQNWTGVGEPQSGTGTIITLTDTDLVDHAFYRVKAEPQ